MLLLQLPTELPADTPDFFWGVLMFIIIGLVVAMWRMLVWILKKADNIVDRALTGRKKQNAPFNENVSTVIGELKKRGDNHSDEIKEMKAGIKENTQLMKTLLGMYGDTQHAIKYKVKEETQIVMKEVNNLGSKVEEVVKKHDEHNSMFVQHDSRISDLENKGKIHKN